MAETILDAQGSSAVIETPSGQQIAIAPPDGGVALRILVEPGDTLAFAFPAGEIQARLDGEALNLQFSNGGVVRLDRFVVAAESSQPPSIVMSDGSVMTAPLLIAAIVSLEAEAVPETAAGTAPQPLTSGIGAYEDDTGELVGVGLSRSGSIDPVDIDPLGSVETGIQGFGQSSSFRPGETDLADNLELEPGEGPGLRSVPVANFEPEPELEPGPGPEPGPELEDPCDPEGPSDVSGVTLIGDQGNDTLRGGTGADLLVGQGGRDDLRGGAGDDVLLGGAGNDKLRGDDGADTLDGGCGVDSLRGGAGDDVLKGGSGNDSLRGDQGDDTLLGGAGRDYLRGGSGEDNLDGGSGGDSLRGEGGADVLRGGEGKDRLRGGSGDDTLEGGSGNDRAFGGAGEDFLLGGEGNDYLNGGTGDDILCGSDGADRMFGGNGADVFVLDLGGAPDLILDFDASKGDVLNLYDILSGDGGAVPAMDADNLDDYLRLSVDGRNTVIEVDATGSGENFSAAAILSRASGFDADQLLEDGAIDLSAPFG